MPHMLHVLEGAADVPPKGYEGPYGIDKCITLNSLRLYLIEVIGISIFLMFLVFYSFEMDLTDIILTPLLLLIHGPPPAQTTGVLYDRAMCKAPCGRRALCKMPQNTFYQYTARFKAKAFCKEPYECEESDFL